MAAPPPRITGELAMVKIGSTQASAAKFGDLRNWSFEPVRHTIDGTASGDLIDRNQPSRSGYVVRAETLMNDVAPYETIIMGTIYWGLYLHATDANPYVSGTGIATATPMNLPHAEVGTFGIEIIPDGTNWLYDLTPAS